MEYDENGQRQEISVQRQIDEEGVGKRKCLNDEQQTQNSEGEVQNPEKQPQSFQEFQKPQLYAYRWIIIALYLLGDLIPSTIVTTTTPIASQISQIYALMPIEVNLSSLIILIVSPLATILSSKFLDEKGLGVCIRIGTAICVGGAWLRVLVNQSFYFVVAGNFLTGIGAPFIFNGKTQIASNWFSHEQGPGVTSFISFWVNLNSIIGFVFAGNYLGDYRFDIDQADDGKNLVWSLMIWIALGVSAIALLVWLFFRQNPPTPPSFTAQIQREHNFKETVQKLLKNRNYVLLVFQQGLFLGSVSGLTTCISYYIMPFGFDSQDSTFMLGAVPVGGVIGTVISSYFLNKYKQYKLQMGICSLGGLGALFFVLIMLYTRNIFLVVTSMGVVGLFFIPMIPTILEFACESVFPIGEGSTVGFLSGASSLFALIYGSVLSFVVKGESPSQTFLGTLIMMSSFGLGFLLLFMTTENLVRHKTEQLRQSQYSEFQSSRRNSQNEIQLANMSSIHRALAPENQLSHISNTNEDLSFSEQDSPDKLQYESPEKLCKKKNQEELSSNEKFIYGSNNNNPAKETGANVKQFEVKPNREIIFKSTSDGFSTSSSSDFSSGSSNSNQQIINSSQIKSNQFQTTPAAGTTAITQINEIENEFKSVPNEVQSSKLSSDDDSDDDDDDEESEGEEGIHRLGSLPETNVINISLINENTSNSNTSQSSSQQPQQQQNSQLYASQQDAL